MIDDWRRVWKRLWKQAADIKSIKETMRRWEQTMGNQLDDFKTAERRLQDDVTRQGLELADLAPRAATALQLAADNKQRIADLTAMIEQIPGDTKALTDAAAAIEANNATIHSTLLPPAPPAQDTTPVDSGTAPVADTAAPETTVDPVADTTTPPDASTTDTTTEPTPDAA